MKTKLTNEQIETMSYTDVANLVLTEYGKKMKVQDLFQKVIKLMNLPESYYESKIADFFQLLSTDQRFIMIEKGYWDLRKNHTKKIVIEDDEEEEEITVEESDEVLDEDTDDNDSEINFDDDTVDDDEEDDELKDFVIVDESDEQEMI